jgi:hypothetical protein
MQLKLITQVLHYPFSCYHDIHVRCKCFFLDPSCVPHLISNYIMFIKLVILNVLYMLFGGVQISFGMQNL